MTHEEAYKDIPPEVMSTAVARVRPVVAAALNASRPEGTIDLHAMAVAAYMIGINDSLMISKDNPESWVKLQQGNPK